MSDYRIDSLSRNLANVHSRREALRLLGVGVAGTAVAAAGLSSAQAKNKQGSGVQDIAPVNTLIGIPLSAEDNNQKFRGTLTVTEFVQEGDSVVAVGKVVGKVTKPNGKGKKKVSRSVRLPVTLPAPEPAAEARAAGVQAAATCQILNLVLGPIDLNLLGLRLQTNQIVVNLTAESGGGLLGDLLCSIANLLNGGSPLNQIIGQIVGFLNQILGVLQGL